MRNFKKIIILALVSALFVTCKKEQLQPSTTENQPVFSFVGSINSNNVNWQAGVNNYYMNSTFTQDSGVYNFTGTLQSTASKNNSLQIIINDDVVVATNAPSDITNSVSANTSYFYKVPGGNPLGDSVTFTSRIYTGTPSAYKYVFGDGTSSSAANPSHYYKFTSNKPTYPSSLTVDFTTCGPVTVNNLVKLSKQATPQLTIDSIVSVLDSLTDTVKKVTYTAQTSYGVSPYTYVWSFGDLTTSSSTSVSASTSVIHTYNGTSKNYTVTLGVTDSQKDTTIYNYNLVDTISSNCRMDYLIATPKPVPNPKALSNVTINYTDGSGNVYTSNSPSQPNISTFQVTTVSSYQNNLNNQATKMLKVTFNCLLFNGSNSISASGTAVIAVAYQ